MIGIIYTVQTRLNSFKSNILKNLHQMSLSHRSNAKVLVKPYCFTMLRGIVRSKKKNAQTELEESIHSSK